MGRWLGAVVDDLERWRAEHREAKRATSRATASVREAEERLVRERRPEAQAGLDAALSVQREALARLGRVRERALLAGVSFRELEP